MVAQFLSSLSHSSLEVGDFLLFRQEDAHDFAYSLLNGMQTSILHNLDK